MLSSLNFFLFVAFHSLKSAYGAETVHYFPLFGFEIPGRAWQSWQHVSSFEFTYYYSNNRLSQLTNSTLWIPVKRGRVTLFMELVGFHKQLNMLDIASMSVIGMPGFGFRNRSRRQELPMRYHRSLPCPVGSLSGE